MHALNPLGVWGSVVSNSLILGVLQAVGPVWTDCMCREGKAIYLLPSPVNAWSPYVDRAPSSHADGRGVRDRSPRCPDNKSGRVSPRLIFAPLPADFPATEERSAPSRFACVLVEPNGSISTAYLLRASSRQTANRALVRMIRSTWRFEPIQPDRAVNRGWQRIRINNTDANLFERGT